MLILAINTATSNTCIALLENNKILAENAWLSDNDEAEKLMPAIYALLKSQSLNFSDIKKVLVVKGPGSFTGLRIGVTVANTIAYLNQCPLNSLTTLDYLHYQNYAAVLLFAGKGAVYLSKKAEDKAKIVDLPDLATELEGIAQVTGDISEEQKNALAQTEFIKPTKSFAEIMLEFLETNPADQTIIEPFYIKQPSISKSKKICFT